MKKFFLAIAFLLLLGTVSAQVQHTITADEDMARINSTVRLECSGSNCPVNSWQLTWRLPDEARVMTVRDSLGRIESYTRTGDRIVIETNRGPARRSETVLISLKLERDAEEIYRGLYRRSFSLPGIQGEETTGTVTVRNLLSGRTGYGFETAFHNDTMSFRGMGSTNLRIKFGEGNETRYFSFFGSTPENTEKAYEIPAGVTGLVQEFRRFPVAVIPDSVYDRKVNGWSAGEYVAGAIQIREPAAIDDFRPVLAHEVVHGLNDRELNWDLTRSSYFDEGSSKYVEFLYRKNSYATGETDKPPRELFGEPVTYDPGPADRSYYELPPKGDADRLWQYYRNDREFMKTWSALSSRPENRDFGYAYSELIIRNYVSRMNGSLRELYDRLDPGAPVEDPGVKWQIFSRYMDMTPCKYDSRERFEACLERINEYDYPVYSAQPVHGNDLLGIKRLEIPERVHRSPEIGFVDFLARFADYLGSLLENLFEYIKHL